MTYSFPLFKLNFDQSEETAILNVLHSKWISTGPKCEEFEGKFADALNAKYAVALDNCTNALHLSLVTLGIGDGDQVLVPSLSFVATVNAVKYVGAQPVFCDIESLENPVIDPYEIERKITPKTKAVIVMHYAGFPCNMRSIKKIADSNNIAVIEDSCHAPLSLYQDKALGTYGSMGCFSFFSNKNISTGEGGMIVTNDEDLYKKLKLLRSHGMTSMSYQRASGHAVDYDVIELGYNYRMDDLRASLGIVQLSKLPQDLQRRKIVRSLYINSLGNLSSIVIPFKSYSERCSNYIFPIVLINGCENKRNYLREYLSEKGIQTSVHYPAIHKFKVYNSPSISQPITEYYSANTLTLPMYGSLNESDIEYISSSVIEGVNNL